jgi:hypothetical protein
MTASPRREVEAKLLRGAAPRGAQARADTQNAGGQDLGDLLQALVGGQEIGMEPAHGSPDWGRDPACRHSISNRSTSTIR